MAPLKRVVLRSKEGQLFPVDLEVARKSKTIGTMCEMLDGTAGASDGDNVIPLLPVDAQSLQLFLEWAERHRQDDKQQAGENQSIDEWDQAFIEKMDIRAKISLVNAANYLDAKPLLDIMIHNIADIMKGKGADEIRNLFDIENDFVQ